MGIKEKCDTQAEKKELAFGYNNIIIIKLNN